MRQLTIAELCQGYIEHAETEFRRPDGQPTQSHRNVKTALKLLIERSGSQSVARMGPDIVRPIMTQWAQTNTPKTLNSKLGWIKTMCRWAKTVGLMLPEQVEAVESIEPVSRTNGGALRKRYRLSWSELKAVVDSPWTTPELSVALRLHWLTGMRSGEFLGIDWSNLSADGTTWWYQPRNHKSQRHGLDRPIPIVGEAKQILHHWMRWTRYSGSGRIFKMNSQTYRIKLRRVLKQLGMAQWGPHDIRRAVATNIHRAMSLDHAAALLGHRDSKTTKQNYSSAEESMAIAAAWEMQKLMKSA